MCHNGNRVNALMELLNFRFEKVVNNFDNTKKAYSQRRNQINTSFSQREISMQYFLSSSLERAYSSLFWNEETRTK
jgi:ribosomal protein L29